jgi:hypothetical protein
MAAVAVMVLLSGLSLAAMVRIVIPMVVEGMGVGLISLEEARSVMNNAIFCNAPMTWALVCLRHSIPIMGKPVHPRGGDGVFPSAVVWDC